MPGVDLEYLLAFALGVLAIPLMYRLWSGPTTVDRVLALETMGSLGVLILAALSVASRRTIYLDVVS